jgi:hypothetical protein
LTLEISFGVFVILSVTGGGGGCRDGEGRRSDAFVDSLCRARHLSLALERCLLKESERVRKKGCASERERVAQRQKLNRSPWRKREGEVC